MIPHRVPRTFLAALTCLVAILADSLGPAAEEDTPLLSEGNDWRVEAIPVLSIKDAKQLESEVKAAYKKLAPSVVCLCLSSSDQDKPISEWDLEHAASNCSGVVISIEGLILTCSHHNEAPGTKIAVRFADGKIVEGKFLGRFQLESTRPLYWGPDLGLAKITEEGEWPAARLHDGKSDLEPGICLAIGYPGFIDFGDPPLLRMGRTLPQFPGLRLNSTTRTDAGDSGGPLFDLSGQVIGIAASQDFAVLNTFQPVSDLSEFRQRLEADEIVEHPLELTRSSRARPSPTTFTPTPDLETKCLSVLRSSFRVMEGGHNVASGLLISSDGWAVTKASLVGKQSQWACRMFWSVHRVMVEGRVVATSPEHDLALMKLDVKDYPVPEWGTESLKIGAIVAAPIDRFQGPLQFSVISAKTRAVPARENDIPQIVLEVEADERDAPRLKLSPESLIPEFDKFRQQFRPGDVVTHLNGIPTPTIDDYGRVMDRLVYAPSEAVPEYVDYSRAAEGSYAGNWVEFRVRRGEESISIPIQKIHSITEGDLNWYSHPLSLRREQFPNVFTHDGDLRPEDCGGAVIDLDGRVVGLNIARADIVRTFAIPTETLLKVVRELREKVESADKPGDQEQRTIKE